MLFAPGISPLGRAVYIFLDESTHFLMTEGARQMGGKLLTVGELSEWLNMTKAEIYRLTYNKAIPYLKISHRKLRFEESSIKEWLERRAVKPQDRTATPK